MINDVILQLVSKSFKFLLFTPHCVTGDFMEDLKPSQDEHTRKRWRTGNIMLFCVIAFLMSQGAVSAASFLFISRKDFAVMISFFTTTIGILAALAVMPHVIDKFTVDRQELDYITELVSELEAHRRLQQKDSPDNEELPKIIEGSLSKNSFSEEQEHQTDNNPLRHSR